MSRAYSTYLVTEADLSAGRSTREIVAAAIDGGIDAVQLREKHTTARERYELGMELREQTREAGIDLLVNDRVDIAAAIDADGVHLGTDDLPIDAARSILGHDAVIGRSVSTVEGARAAKASGADYLGVGAVFTTTSKADVEATNNGIGVERVAEIASAVDVPVVGIGGVTAENAASVIEAGADGVAVISAITAAEDSVNATHELRTAVERRLEGR
ncbi:thiamine phosphate synthase [Halalkalicoccus subterraneus]|uniref:thiamine phosphate synthase n=1 Tax=Halalkalicoccus subterraneus TaxID=2675002 RepID=UPI000EFB7A26|nr:thiamine phosphate synthase [Halalkalicoccus subterraneus]